MIEFATVVRSLFAVSSALETIVKAAELMREAPRPLEITDINRKLLDVTRLSREVAGLSRNPEIKREPPEEMCSGQENHSHYNKLGARTRRSELERSHSQMATICLEIIEGSEVGGLLADMREKQRPNLEHFLKAYAFSYWHYHVRNASRSNRGLQEKVHRCLSRRYERHLKEQGGPKEPSWEQRFSYFLMLSARYGLADLAKTYLEMGTSTESISGEHQGTPLHMAARSGSASVVQVLLNHGASLNKVDRDGNSALHFAAYRGDGDIATLLLRAGADPEGQQRPETSKLEWAAHERSKTGTDLDSDSV